MTRFAIIALALFTLTTSAAMANAPKPGLRRSVVQLSANPQVREAQLRRAAKVRDAKAQAQRNADAKQAKARRSAAWAKGSSNTRPAAMTHSERAAVEGNTPKQVAMQRCRSRFGNVALSVVDFTEDGHHVWTCGLVGQSPTFVKVDGVDHPIEGGKVRFSDKTAIFFYDVRARKVAKMMKKGSGRARIQPVEGLGKINAIAGLDW